MSNTRKHLEQRIAELTTTYRELKATAREVRINKTEQPLTSDYYYSAMASAIWDRLTDAMKTLEVYEGEQKPDKTEPAQSTEYRVYIEKEISYWDKVKNDSMAAFGRLCAYKQALGEYDRLHPTLDQSPHHYAFSIEQERDRKEWHLAIESAPVTTIAWNGSLPIAQANPIDVNEGVMDYLNEHEVDIVN